MNTAILAPTVRKKEINLPANSLTRGLSREEQKQSFASAQLLLIADDSERLESLRRYLQDANWQFQCWLVSQRAESLSASPSLPDLVIVDVASGLLSRVLREVRGLDAQLPILVEASRLSEDLLCTGLLPSQRAMPCLRQNLLRLVNNQLRPQQRALPPHKLL